MLSIPPVHIVRYGLASDRANRGLRTASGGLLLLLMIGLFSAITHTHSGRRTSMSDRPVALMRAVYPDWRPERTRKMGSFENAKFTATRQFKIMMWEINAQRANVRLQPVIVVRLSRDQAMLIVSKEGEGHVSPAELSAYWFERKQGFWYLLNDQVHFGSGGYFGDSGDIQIRDLGNGRQALSIEYGSCWFGQCIEWLQLFAIRGRRLVDMLVEENDPRRTDGVQGNTISVSSGNFDERCEALVGMPPYVAHDDDDLSWPMDCWFVQGNWHVGTQASASTQLVVDFSGVELNSYAICRAFSAPIDLTELEERAFASSEIELPYRPYVYGDRAWGCSDYENLQQRLVWTQPINERLAYALVDDHFERVSGENPNPDGI